MASKMQKGNKELFFLGKYIKCTACRIIYPNHLQKEKEHTYLSVLQKDKLMNETNFYIFLNTLIHNFILGVFVGGSPTNHLKLNQ